MRGAAPARKGDNKIGLSLAQHSFVADQRRVPPFFFPLGRKLDQVDARHARPLAGNSIDTARVSLDHDIKPISGMEPVQFGVNEASIGEIPPTADQHFQQLASIKVMSFVG